MAREAVKVEVTNSTGFPRRFLTASAATITKGAILKFATPRTASLSTGTGDVVAGIAAFTKTADYSTEITVLTDCICTLVASGAIVAGDCLKTAAPGNYVMTMTATASTAICIGYALSGAAADGNVDVRVSV